jgi:hypothetical protein
MLSRSNVAIKSVALLEKGMPLFVWHQAAQRLVIIAKQYEAPHWFVLR